jgi:phosphoglycolate phosphatase
MRWRKPETAMPKPIIVFDLDGTLVDTAPDLLASLNHALARDNLDPVEGHGFERHISRGARVMIEQAYIAQDLRPEAEKTDLLFGYFLEHYRANMPGLSKPYDGVMDTVRDFAEAGYLAAVCTNKTEVMAVALLEALGIDGAFAAICGQDTFPVRKPDPAHLTGTIAMAGGDVNLAIMVGDSETDILTAQAAGIPVVAVDFGYTDRHVREFGPDSIISHYDEFDLALADRLLAQHA